MELPGGLADPEAALRRLAGPPGRLSRVLYKQGPRGGLAFDVAADRFERWRPSAAEIVDPTGAGDAFAGGLLAGRLLGDAPAAAIARGLVSASFALAGDGPEALLRAAPTDRRRAARRAGAAIRAHFPVGGFSGKPKIARC